MFIVYVFPSFLTFKAHVPGFLVNKPRIQCNSVTRQNNTASNHQIYIKVQYNNILAGTSRCQNQDNQLFNVKFGNLMR